MKRTFIISTFICAVMLTACNGQSKKENNDEGKTVLECIMTRTSIRAYTEQPVEEEKVEALLRSGMAAPTAVNAQPWHFVVVADKGKLGELAAANPYAKMLETAPLAIVVCGDMNKGRWKARDGSSGFKTAQLQQRTSCWRLMHRDWVLCGLPFIRRKNELLPSARH